MTLTEAHQHLFSDEVPPMTDREAEELVEREEALECEGGVGYIAPPPVELMALHECQKIDSREAYEEMTDWQDIQRTNEDDEACPLALWYDTSAELEGVY